MRILKVLVIFVASAAAVFLILWPFFWPQYISPLILVLNMAVAFLCGHVMVSAWYSLKTPRPPTRWGR